METAFQQLVNGLSLGSTYAVFAMGFTLIFGVLNILNMAQGSIFMAGAYFGLEAGKLGLPGPLALLVSIVGAGFLSVVAELLVFRQLRRRGAHRWMGLVASLALARMLVAAAQEIFGTQVQRYPSDWVTTSWWEIAGVRFQLLQVLIIAASGLLMVFLAFTLRRTSIGRAIRTVAFDENVARIVGIPVGRAVIATFFLAGGLAGGAGLLLGALFNVVSPFMGDNMLIKGLTVIILGGLGNIIGAVMAGFLLGMIEIFSVSYLSSAFRDAIGFGLVFSILLVRPTGLFATREERRA
jgi:branched-chain amino acid transport system permease protein